MSSLEIVAMLSKIIFQAENNGFAVAEFIDSQSAKRFKASGRILTFGKADTQQQYRLFGQWDQNPKYGQTFGVVYCEPVRPPSLKGIVPFLANNVKGVGETTANKLLEHIKVVSLDELILIAKNQSEKIFEFFKNKRHIAQAIISLLSGDEIYRSIMIFLHEHNIPTNFAQKIFERYGSEAVAKLTENPYRLISDFRNVGFVKADIIAQKLGISSLSPFRLEAAIIFCLEMGSLEGHCCLPRDVLITKAMDVLGSKKNSEITFDFVLNSLRTIYKNNRDQYAEKFVLRLPKQDSDALVSPDKMLFYLPTIYEKENVVASLIGKILKIQNLGAENSQIALSSLSNIMAAAPDLPWNKLSQEQHQAVETSVHSRIMVLTGGPGCGKTFVLRAIYQMQQVLKRNVVLCAPTGLAAKRMSSSIQAPASTLHKLLRLGGRPSFQQETLGFEESNVDIVNEDVLAGVDMVIIDESSMLSLEILYLFLNALGTHRRLILVGDKDQLPSVGAGNCLRDIIDSCQIPTVKLTKIFRQSHESPIPIAAQQMINGQPPTFTFKSRTVAFARPEPLAFVTCKTDEFLDLMLEFIKRTLPEIYGKSSLKDWQILVPMRRGDVGQEKINNFLQRELNPAHPDKDECALHDGVLRVGDKVMQTRNNYEKDVFNGDLGYCRWIKVTKEKTEAQIDFLEKSVVFEDEELEDLQLCYAMTVHKSQGSEFPICIIPIFSAYYTMLDRNLLYTALTRASQSAVFFGEEWAIKKAVKNTSSSQRYTNLQSLIRESLR